MVCEGWGFGVITKGFGHKRMEIRPPTLMTEI